MMTRIVQVKTCIVNPISLYEAIGLNVDVTRPHSSAAAIGRQGVMDGTNRNNSWPPAQLRPGRVVP